MRPQARIHAVRVIAGDLAGVPIDGGKAADAWPGHFDEHARKTGARKPEAEICATLGGRHLGADAGAFRGAQRHGVVVRFGGFVVCGRKRVWRASGVVRSSPTCGISVM